MIERILNRLFSHNDIVVGSPANVYMRRWFIRDVGKGSWGLRIHHIRLPDPGRDLHDHPFDFVSLLLKGGYTEVTPEGSKWRHRFSIASRRAADFHRISELRGHVWTLVATSRHKREWGFSVDESWIPKGPYNSTSGMWTTKKVRGNA